MRNGAWTHPEFWADVTSGDHVYSVVDALPSHNGVQLAGNVAVRCLHGGGGGVLYHVTMCTISWGD